MAVLVFYLMPDLLRPGGDSSGDGNEHEDDYEGT